MPAFMAFPLFFSFFLGIFSAIGLGAAETHTIKFVNQYVTHEGITAQF
jgi:hypothetical protein